MVEKVFPAKIEMYDEFRDYVDAYLEANDCNMATMMKIDVCLEEIFANIAHYAYDGKEGDMTFQIDHIDDYFKFVFIDAGMYFDPLKKDDPNIDASAEERDIGGLGIFMVKKMMDSVEYEYKDNKNILTLTKKDA